MRKLYKLADSTKRYWEYWDSAPREFIVHWGELGTRGESKVIKSGPFGSIPRSILSEADELSRNGFTTVEFDDHAVLMIEYPIDGMGTDTDLEKRHRLEDRMNETLGWTGLGMCDGGSTGSNTMEVCCLVVDFEIAMRVVSEDLKGTEFGSHSRIYQEAS